MYLLSTFKEIKFDEFHGKALFQFGCKIDKTFTAAVSQLCFEIFRGFCVRLLKAAKFLDDFLHFMV